MPYRSARGGTAPAYVVLAYVVLAYVVLAYVVPGFVVPRLVFRAFGAGVQRL